MAQWCRQCGQEISIKKAQEERKRLYGMTSTRQSPRVIDQLDVSRLGASYLHAMCIYRGYLFLGTQGAGLIVTNAMRPQNEAILSQILTDEEVLALSPIETVQGPLVFVTTRRIAYRLSCLPAFRIEAVYITPEEFSAPVCGTEAGPVMFEREGEQVRVRQLELHTHTILHTDLLPSLRATENIRCVPVAPRRFLLFTATSGVLYDSQARQVVWHGNTPETGLDGAVEPFYASAQQQVFLGGRQTVWRFALTGEHPYAFIPVSDDIWDGFQFSVSPDGRNLCLAHDNGLSILDSFTGRREWESASTLGMRAAAGLFPPLFLGGALLFGQLNRQGGQGVRLLSPSRDDIMVIGDYSQVLHTPILGMDCMLLGVRKGEIITIQALSL